MRTENRFTNEKDKGGQAYIFHEIEFFGMVAQTQAVFGKSEKQARQASMYLCHQFSGNKLQALAEGFCVRASAISEVSWRFRLKMETDEGLRLQK